MRKKKEQSNPFAQPWFDWTTMDSVEIRKAIRLVCMILRSNNVTEARITRFLHDMGFDKRDFPNAQKEPGS